MMKQGLHLGMSQQLALTPQLQQAIRMLQLSSVELEQEIEEALRNNIMLEQVGEEENSATVEAGEVQSTSSAEDERTRDQTLDNDLDSANWDNSWEPEPFSQSSGLNSGAEAWEQGPWAAKQAVSLREHLLWQLNLASFTPKDAMIALTLIDALDEDGYLHESLESIATDLSRFEVTTVDEIEPVLCRLQHFDPIGVAARDLRETLLLQLSIMPEATPHLALATRLVAEHMNQLPAREHSGLCRTLSITEEEFRGGVHLIQQLDPRPGASLTAQEPEYIVPDVYVYHHQGRWQVELNAHIQPRLRINALYTGILRQSNNLQVATLLKQHLQEARWFIKSLKGRNETLLKVANAIVMNQLGFMEYGEEYMRPMVLREIAEVVEMHESTISRVVSQKYMHTPRGVFSFKYFFSSQLQTADGQTCSATAIYAMVRKLVAAEDPKQPLSDQKLAEILEERGIHVARRTIAKYRQGLSIPHSSERRRLI